MKLSVRAIEAEMHAKARELRNTPKPRKVVR